MEGRNEDAQIRREGEQEEGMKGEEETRVNEGRKDARNGGRQSVSQSSDYQSDGMKYKRLRLCLLSCFSPSGHAVHASHCFQSQPVRIQAEVYVM